MVAPHEVPPLPRNLAAVPAPGTYAKAALSDATRRAYRADWAHFTEWCGRHGIEPAPCSVPDLVRYLESSGPRYARATIVRRLITINHANDLKGNPGLRSHPAVRATLKGIWRLHGRPPVKAAALGLEEVRRLLAACPRNLTGLRDRALFLISFAGALRRSEAAAIEARDIAFRSEGVRIFLPRTKESGEGEGALIEIPRGRNLDTCPVNALARWLHACPADGPIFRAIRNDGTVSDRALDPHSVGRILQRRAKAAGIEAPARERISAHGFRAGFVTEAYRAGLRDEEIMGHSRHTSLDVMRGYVRRSKLVTESPAGKLGL